MTGYMQKKSGEQPDLEKTFWSEPSDSGFGEALKEGSLIAGQYCVESVLGRGGMGIVYKCRDQISGVSVAVKTIAPELSGSGWEMEHIKENFQLVHKLHHPHIANYNALVKDKTSGLYYLIMEFVEGEDLRSYLSRQRKNGNFSDALVMKLFAQIASALDYAHSEKILHRDIKPGNIMIDSNGNVKLLDFGLAAQIHSSLSRVSLQKINISGTLPYIAPEQWRGEPAKSATDQYSLAATVYEVFSGYPPFDSADREIMRDCALNQPPRPLQNVSKAIRKAVAKALSKKAEDRFDSCSDFIDAMQSKGGFKLKQLFGFLRRQKKDHGAKGESKFKQRCGKIAASVFSGLYRAISWISCRLCCIALEHPKLFLVLITGIVVLVVWICFFTTPKVEMSESKVIVNLQKDLKLNFLKVKRGKFKMGSPENEPGRQEDETLHNVTLSQDYYIGSAEITRAQYDFVMSDRSPSRTYEDDQPVTNVSWQEARDFCEKLNEKYPLPKGWKYDLPTEAQWEKACRELVGATTFTGGVWEWCLDSCWREGRRIITHTYYGDMQDPFCEKGNLKIKRGGSGYHGNEGSGTDLRRAAARAADSPYAKDQWSGFRVAVVRAE